MPHRGKKSLKSDKWNTRNLNHLSQGSFNLACDPLMSTQEGSKSALLNNSGHNNQKVSDAFNFKLSSFDDLVANTHSFKVGQLWCGSFELAFILCWRCWSKLGFLSQEHQVEEAVRRLPCYFQDPWDRCRCLKLANLLLFQPSSLRALAFVLLPEGLLSSFWQLRQCSALCSPSCCLSQPVWYLDKNLHSIIHLALGCQIIK